MNKPILFFDTYAIIEVIKGNPKYFKYLDFGVILNDFVLSELCYILIKLYDEKTAYAYVDKYSQFILRADTAVIKEAMKLKHDLRKNKLSMTDCIGYVQAVKLNMKFLTGDKEFEKLPNVEFQKQ